MKIFNQLLNEALSAQVNTDYTRFLVEKQYALTKETARILLEQEEDDDGDGAPDVPFNRTYRGNKIYVHLDVDGRREIQVVDSLDDAKILAKNYKSGVAYDNGGNELQLEDASDALASLPNIPGLGYFADIGRRKAKGAAVSAVSQQPSGVLDTILRGFASGMEALQGPAEKLGLFGDTAKPSPTMADRDKQIAELKAKLDQYELEARQKGYKTAEEIPFTDEEQANINRIVKREKEKTAPSLPEEEKELLGLGQLPKIQLQGYQDYLKTATKYQGKALADYYAANPEKFEQHEPYMETEIATRLMPLSTSEQRGSALPKGLEKSTLASASKFIESVPETSAIMAAAAAAPSLVGGAVARSPVPISITPAGAKMGTDVALRAYMASQGVPAIAGGEDVVKKFEGLLMTTPAAAAFKPLVTPALGQAARKAAYSTIENAPLSVRKAVIDAQRLAKSTAETAKEVKQAVTQKPKEAAAAGLIALSTLAEPKMPAIETRVGTVATEVAPSAAKPSTGVAPKPAEVVSAEKPSATSTSAAEVGKPVEVSRPVSTKTETGLNFKGLLDKVSAATQASAQAQQAPSETDAAKQEVKADQNEINRAAEAAQNASDQIAKQNVMDVAPATVASAVAAAPVVTTVVTRSSASSESGGGEDQGGKEPKGKEKGKPSKPGGGIPSTGGGDFIATDTPSPESTPKSDQPSWDLLMKQIYGKQAATLTK